MRSSIFSRISVSALALLSIQFGQSVFGNDRAFAREPHQLEAGESGIPIKKYATGKLLEVKCDAKEKDGFRWVEGGLRIGETLDTPIEKTQWVSLRTIAEDATLSREFANENGFCNVMQAKMKAFANESFEFYVIDDSRLDGAVSENGPKVPFVVYVTEFIGTEGWLFYPYIGRVSIAPIQLERDRILDALKFSEVQSPENNAVSGGFSYEYKQGSTVETGWRSFRESGTSYGKCGTCMGLKAAQEQELPLDVIQGWGSYGSDFDANGDQWADPVIAGFLSFGKKAYPFPEPLQYSRGEKGLLFNIYKTNPLYAKYFKNNPFDLFP